MGRESRWYPQSSILVFCRAPVAGRVKTRLIPALGERGAAALHEELARERIGLCVNARLAPVELWCEPSVDHPFFAEFEPGVDLREQTGTDLGERMARALTTSLTEPGRQGAVLIGTDCPTLDSSYLALALAQLEHHDAVIGPAEDGGYGLIGLRQVDPAIFQGMQWGSDSVLADTCRVFNRLRLNFALLPLLWDVDRPADVERYRVFRRRQAGGAS